MKRADVDLFIQKFEKYGKIIFRIAVLLFVLTPLLQFLNSSGAFQALKVTENILSAEPSLNLLIIYIALFIIGIVLVVVSFLTPILNEEEVQRLKQSTEEILSFKLSKIVSKKMWQILWVSVLVGLLSTLVGAFAVALGFKNLIQKF